MKITDKYENNNSNISTKDYELDDLIEFSRTVNVLYISKKDENLNDILSVFKIFFVNIDITYDGESGFEMFKSNKYDLIITSTELDVLDCIPMVTKIRELNRQITILALSDKEKYLIELIRLGIDGYIITPIEINQFLNIMKKVITTLLDKEQLTSYKTNLEQMLDEKSKELIEINKNLEVKIKDEIEKNRLKDLQIFEQVKMSHMGEMISNIAHQWRQPLSAISTLASSTIIENEMEILDKSSLEYKMQTIMSKTKYLSNTINTFRSLTNNDRSIEDILVKEEVTECIKIFKSLLNINIEIIENIDEDQSIKLNMVHGELAQVMMNFLNNSKESIIEREIKNPWIKVDLKKTNNKIKITIEDNAKGIDEEIISKIFNPYFTTKHQTQGKGLGLHIAHRIITESFGGKISVKNSENGAIFTIEL